MKGYDIFKAMGDTEEKYLDMSESRPAAKSSPRVIKIAFAAAAAAALTVGIGAYTYSQFNNPESVEMYLENTDKVEASGNVVNQVMENGHLRITVDTVLSDGYQALVLVTLDALDDYGRNYINYHPSIMMKRTDTGEPVVPAGGGSIDWRQDTKDTVRYYHTIALCDKDISCDYDIIFFSHGLFSSEDWANANGTVKEVDENWIPFDNPLGYDFIARVNFEKNVDTVTLTGKSGKELILSQFELISERGDIIDGFIPDVSLIKNDGTREEIDCTKMHGLGNGESYTLFLSKFIDLDEYRGVEIDGVEYLKA